MKDDYEFSFALRRLLTAGQVKKEHLHLLHTILKNIRDNPQELKYRQVKATKLPEPVQQVLLLSKFQRKIHQFEEKFCFHYNQESSEWEYLERGLEIVGEQLQSVAETETSAAIARRKIEEEKQKWKEQADLVKLDWIERQAAKRQRNQPSDTSISSSSTSTTQVAQLFLEARNRRQPSTLATEEEEEKPTESQK